jgi:hypothetical protein
VFVVKLKVPPLGATLPESNVLLSSDVTVWLAKPVLVQVIVSPTVTVRDGGL